MPPRPRSLAAYLVLPRPGDSVKWLILPVGFAIGAVTRQELTSKSVIDALVVWFSLELLVYQARYQWNDIRGFEADQRHPDGDRGRLPGPPERGRPHKSRSAAAAVGKVGLAVGIAGILGGSAGLTLVTSGVAVFAVAVMYERLRAVSTGRTGAVPSPLTPGIAAIWVVVGAGYAIRVLTGLSLAVEISEPSALAPVAALAAWSFGIAWVTSRWAVEATAFADVGSGRLTWSATAEHAREHQLALVRWLPGQAPPEVQARGLEHWRPAGASKSLRAPWHIAALVAGATSVVAGGLLVAPDLSSGQCASLAALGLLATLSLVETGERRALALPVTTVVLVVALLLLGITDPVFAAIPWLVLSLTQVVYLRQERATLGNFSARLAKLLRPRRTPSAPAADQETEWMSTS